MQAINIYTVALTSLISLSGIVFTYLASKRNNWNAGVTQFRQQWINNLRDALSLFIAKAETISMTDYHDDNLYFAHFTELSQSYNKVILLLNPNDPDYQAVLKQMDEIRQLIHSEEEEKFENDAEFQIYFDNQIAGLLKVSQIVLKREWNVIKKGK